MFVVDLHIVQGYKVSGLHTEKYLEEKKNKKRGLTHNHMKCQNL